MKKITLTMLFVFCVAVTFAKNEGNNCNTAISHSNTTQQIQGTVIDKLTGEALAGVSLNIIGNNKNFYTDFKGNFSIDGIAPGIYNINISYISYKQITLKEICASDEISLKIELETISPNSL